MNIDQILNLARANVGKNPTNESSARLCLADAIACLDSERFDDAKQRALKSLAYSIGVFSNDYKRAAK